MSNKNLSRGILIETIEDAARPRLMSRRVERTVLGPDGEVVRVEREVQEWTEPADVSASIFLLEWAFDG